VPFIKTALPQKIVCKTLKTQVGAFLTFHFYNKSHKYPTILDDRIFKIFDDRIFYLLYPGRCPNAIKLSFSVRATIKDCPYATWRFVGAIPCGCP